MRRSSSGISPVVATVILVAIAIVIAIAVAFWASGLVGVFTRFEKLEIRSAYVSGDDVILKVKNTGSADTTIDDIFINGKPSSEWGITSIDCVNKPLTVGAETTCTISNFVTDERRGVTFEFAVHTASGKMYPVAVLIP